MTDDEGLTCKSNISNGLWDGLISLFIPAGYGVIFRFGDLLLDL